MKKSLKLSLTQLIIIVYLGICVLSAVLYSPLRYNLGTAPSTPVPPYKVYSDTLPLPDGRVLPMACVNNAPNYTWCTVEFPSGQKFDAPYDKIWGTGAWSPDQRYVIRCARSTHDSSCLDGLQIWDMVAGEPIGGLSLVSMHEWIPEQPHTLAYIEGSGYMRPIERLVYFDAGMRKETYPNTCPDRILQKINSASPDWMVKACRAPAPTPP